MDLTNIWSRQRNEESWLKSSRVLKRLRNFSGNVPGSSCANHLRASAAGQCLGIWSPASHKADTPFQPNCCKLSRSPLALRRPRYGQINVAASYGTVRGGNGGFTPQMPDTSVTRVCCRLGISIPGRALMRLRWRKIAVFETRSNGTSRLKYRKINLLKCVTRRTWVWNYCSWVHALVARRLHRPWRCSCQEWRTMAKNISPVQN